MNIHVSVQYVTATHVCGSSYLRQKYSSRDESKVSTSQSLEEISVHNVHFPCSGRVFAALSCSAQYQVFSRTPDISQNLAVKSKWGLGYLAQLATCLLLTLQVPLRSVPSPGDSCGLTSG